MAHIGIRYIPFALAMLPFLAIGIGAPATFQDWHEGRLAQSDELPIIAGVVFVGAWERAILFGVKHQERRGKVALLGRELRSWYWAPPITFMVGLVAGLFLC